MEMCHISAGQGRPIETDIASSNDLSSQKSDHVVLESGIQHDVQAQSCGNKYRVRSALFKSESDLGGDLVTRHDNPFFGWRKREVQTVAQRIACEYGLTRLEPLFINAAKVLHKPDLNLDSDEANFLLPEEREALRFERKATFWDQPLSLQTTFLMLFVAAVNQGWNQTATTGANLIWPCAVNLREFNKVDGTCSAPDSAATGLWKYAAVNAAPYFAASLGCWSSDPVINELLFGRRGAIMLSAILIFASAIGGAFVNRWWELLLCRLLLGIGMGCKAAVVPVFAAEIAPAHLRGSLVMNWQVFDALGIFLGYTANLFAYLAGEPAWRWQIASSAIPAYTLLWGVVFICWDSPRYLMKHEGVFQDRHKARKDHEREAEWSRKNGRPALRDRLSLRKNPVGEYRSAAYETLLLLRGHPILAAKELIYAHCQLLVEMHSTSQSQAQDMDFSLRSQSDWLKRTWQIFSISYIRREAYAAGTAMISQQLCGINFLIFYSTSLFKSANSGPDWASLLLSWGLGLTNVLFAIPAYWLIESKGRRWLLITTTPLLAICMAGAAASFKAPQFSSTELGLSTLFTYLFTIFYSPGLGPVPFTLSAEMFPLEHRMVGMSLAVSINFLGAGILTFFSAAATNNQSYVLGAFAALNVVAFAFVWIFVREVAGGPTRNTSNRMTYLSLEELFYIFESPTMMHIKYQWTEQASYIWRTLQLWKGECEPPRTFREWDADNRASRRSFGG